MAETVERDSGRDAAREAPGRRAKRPVLLHYVLARHEGTRLELLHVTLKSGKQVLPVFTSRRAAQNILFSKALSRGWYARESYAGDLLSLLCGLYAGTEWVLLDPLPERLAVEDLPANLMRWEDFVDYLLV